MKIVILNDYGYLNGGAGQIALSSAIALARRGYDTTVFVAVPPIMPELRASHLDVVCCDQHDILTDPRRLRAAAQGIWNVKAARRMDQLLDGLPRGETILHAHTWSKSLSSSVLRTAMRRKFPVICTLHDYFAACPNGTFFNFPQNRICRLRGLSCHCLRSNCDVRSYPQKLWRFARNMVQKHLGHLPKGVSHFIVVSNFCQDVFAPYLPAAAGVSRLDNPIDMPQSEPVEVHENRRFIAVGQVTRLKGVDIFARAAAALQAEAVFVGEGPCRAEVAAIYPSALVTGWKSRGEVVQWLRTALALVFPSLCFETQGLAVLEAAALGVPAIVPDTCAAREMVGDGATGLWFKGGDADDLARQMRRLLDDAALARRLGQAAYDRFHRQAPTMEHHLDGLLKIYEAVLGA
jgi:glycosyltransferase involved in cell wall biosynthesis